MATFQYYMTGSQIGTYSWSSGQGNNDEMVVTLHGVQAIGGPTDYYRIVVTQANDNDTTLRNGQRVEVYTWSESNPTGTLVWSGLNPQHDMYQDRASGGGYQMFDGANPKVIFDLRGVNSGVITYAQDTGESRFERMTFDNFAKTPQELFPVVCFLRGTGILTRKGLVAVEDLRVGDRIWTRDSGAQKIRWIGATTACGFAHLAPVRFEAGVLGNERPVWLSQQHRVLVSGWRAQLHFGEEDVLAAALHLVDGDRIRLDPRPVVEYWHIALDRHEVLCAEGMLAESLFTGPVAIEALSPAARAEIMALFPQCFGDNGRAPLTTKPCLTAREARVLQMAG